MNETDLPLLQSKLYDAQSVFRPENFLREARRQKRLAAAAVPEVCVLDPDGDLVRHLRAAGRAKPDAGWACYHTELFIFEERGETFGLVGCAVGAPFAVLVAEQLFASGCRLLVSVTSSRQIIASGPTPYFVLIERALRDEGTSYHAATRAVRRGGPRSCQHRPRRALRGRPPRFIAVRPGPRMHPFARRRPPSRWHKTGNSLPLRWRRPPSMRLHKHAGVRSCALRTSPTLWRKPKAISTRATRRGQPMRLKSSAPPLALGGGQLGEAARSNSVHL